MLRSSQYIRSIWSRNLHETTTLCGKQLLNKLRDDIDPLTIRKHHNHNHHQRKLQRKTHNEEFENKSTTSYNLNGALKVLQNQYDSVTFRDYNNKPIDIQKLTTQQIKYSSLTSKIIFKNLMQVKKLSGRQINRNLALALLGTDGKQLKDSYYISQNVKELLKIDDDIERAMYLCQISDKQCSIVAQNEILSWLLSKGKINEALKLYSKRKSSGIPTNLQTYVILFHGIAKSISWDGERQQSSNINEELFNRVERIFKTWRLELVNKSEFKSKNQINTVPIEVFNACLSVLVKDFRDEQFRAWNFFNELMANPKENLPSIIPDSKTFTIFLKGVKKYFDHEMEEIMNKTQPISHNERIIKLLDIEAGHIKTSQKIFERAKSLAMPPNIVDTDTDTVNDDNQEINSYNIHKWYKERIELDSPLITSYVSLLCNGGVITTDSGIKTKIPIGSHYLYNEKAISILKQSSPEINSLLKFIKQVTKEKEEGHIVAKKLFKSRIDKKINLVMELAMKSNVKLKFNDKIKDLDPYKIANLIKDKNFNPDIIIPSKNNKTFKKLTPIPLIDFTRHDGIKKNFLPHGGLTKFLLMPLFDSLTNIGKLNEFVIAFWYSMIRWGGINVNLSIFNNKPNVLNGVFIDLPETALSNNGNKEPDRCIIDEVTPGIFINKISEYGREKGLTKTHLIIELFQSLISKDLNSSKNGIQIQLKHLTRIWWVLHDDLQYYNAFNLHNNNNKKKKNNNNHHHHHNLRYIQLEQFFNNLISFSDINYQWSKNLLMSKPIPDEFIEQINQIIISLHNFKWFNIIKDESKKIYFYKLMLKSTIKLLIPNRFIIKNGSTSIKRNGNYPKLMEPEIIRYLFIKLCKTKNLTDNNVKLLIGLKNFRNAKPCNEEESKRLFMETTNAIYDAIEIGDTKFTKSDNEESKTGETGETGETNENKSVETNKDKSVEAV